VSVPSPLVPLWKLGRRRSPVPFKWVEASAEI
jgi:hypothetical protein